MGREVGLVVVIRVVGGQLVGKAGRERTWVAAMVRSKTSEPGHGVRGVHGEREAIIAVHGT